MPFGLTADDAAWGASLCAEPHARLWFNAPAAFSAHQAELARLHMHVHDLTRVSRLITPAQQPHGVCWTRRQHAYSPQAGG